MKSILILPLLAICLTAGAQIIEPDRRAARCTTGDLDSISYLPGANEEMLQALSEAKNARTSATAPYNVRVFIRIVRNDNGTLPGCSVEQAIENFDGMVNQFRDHNICFQLMGIDHVNDTYLNNFNNEDNIDEVYPDYIRNNNLNIAGAITIFVHYNYLNNNGSSGNAYGIPNNFLSVARWAAQSANVRSIFGHEMGHCLGLYHTFRIRNSIRENVTRNSGNFCYNCTTEGDLCCDTPADYPDSEDHTNGTTCVYNGNETDNCLVPGQYAPSTVNIMSYQPWGCIATDGAALTPNQRTRMHVTLLNPLSPVSTSVAEDNVTLGNANVSTGVVRVYSAKNSLSTSNGATITHNQNAQSYFAAGRRITFGPGVTLAPGANGVMLASITGCP